MASVQLTLDRRSKKIDGTYPLKYTISHAGRTALIPAYISVLPEHWDKAKRKVIARADKYLVNAQLTARLNDIERAILQLRFEGKVKGRTAIQLRDMILSIIEPEQVKPVTFADFYARFAARHENKRTREIYEATLAQIKKYDVDINKKHFEDINRAWLDGFFVFMSNTSPSVNARNIHLRNIRAAFNAALDDNITAAYPFRRYKIHPVATRKRNLKPDTLLSVFNADVPEWQQKYIDMFKLTFLLIGINPADLFSLPSNADTSGRIEYNRRKTHRLYSIKVEPESREIINRYRGEKNLLNVTDHCKSYRPFAQRLNHNLRLLHSGLTLYWARHSWATIAADLDISEDVIALALGHSSAHSTTAIYIQRDLRKVDDANRKVIDFVLYGKK